MEVCFVFPLPYDGAIDQLTLLVDGKEYDAKLLSKEEARRRYEEIVRKNRDPALLEWVGTGMFQTSVFPIPAGREADGHAPLLAALPQDARPHRFLCSRSARPSTPSSRSRSSRSASRSKAHAESRTSTRRRTPSNIERPDNKHAVVKFEAEEHDSRRRLPPVLRRRRRRASARASSAIGPKADEDGYFLLLASPEDQSRRRRSRSPRRSSSSSTAPAA